MTESVADLLQELEQLELPNAVAESPLVADSAPAVVGNALQLAVTAPTQLAIGWWLLLAAILMSVGLIAWLVYRQRRANRYRRIAQMELNKLHAICDDGEFIRATALLLKRVVVHNLDASANTRFGEPWQQQLQRYYPKLSDSAAFAMGVGQYQPAISLQKATLYTEISAWLKHHHVRPFVC